MRWLRNMLKDSRGASLAEFALIFPLFAILFFGVLEMGYLMWQVQEGAIASKRAVRIAVTRTILTPGSVNDCGPGLTSSAGTLCANVAGSDTWGPITCPGDAECNGPEVARVITEINKFYPASASGTVIIESTGAGLGFQGMGKPVPIVTVRFENVPFRFIVLQAFAGLGPMTMPAMSSSAPAEDLTNGSGA